MNAVRASQHPQTLPLGIEGGVYLQSEAALLSGLKQTTVRRWLDLEGGTRGLPGLTDQPLVSFHDLISLRAIAALTRAGMKLRNIKAGADVIRRERGLSHPLAWEALKTNGVALYFPEAQTLVAASEGGQLAAQELVAEYLRDVRYKPLAGGYRLAASWEPPGVSIDPLIQRGAPCIAGTRMQIVQLKRYLDAGDTPEYLAELFELSADEIRRAVHWYEESKLAA